MKRNYFLMFLAVLTGLTVMVPAQSVSVHLDPSQLIHVEGTVASIQAAPGDGSPRFVLQTADSLEMTCQTGPYWFFDVAGFVLAVGDEVGVDAFASLDPALNLYYAAKITNLATGAEIVLRDEAGLPQWTGGRRFGGPGQGHGGPAGGSGSGSAYGDGTCDGSGRGGQRRNGQGDPDAGRQGGVGLELADIQEAAGTVTATALVLGRRDSTFTLTDGLGDSLDVRVGPLWFLAVNGFSLTMGDSVETTIASRTGDPLHVYALQIRNLTTGVTIVLRDEYGFPLWRW
jgi:hypothetical protein